VYNIGGPDIYRYVYNIGGPDIYRYVYNIGGPDVYRYVYNIGGPDIYRYVYNIGGPDVYRYVYNNGGLDIYRYVFHEIDEFLKIQHLKRQEFLLFTRIKEPSLMKEADLRDMFDNAFKSVLSQLLWYVLAISMSSAVKTLEGPDDPEPVAEGDMQIEYSSY
jgi:hypothetical protein